MVAGSKSREILNYTFLSALADDGVIDDGELSFIKSLALADGVLDEEERRALKRIFSLVDQSRLSDVAKAELQRFRAHYNL